MIQNKLHLSKLILLFIGIFMLQTTHAQNLVANGDFEELSQYGFSRIAFQCYWAAPSHTTVGVPSNPQPNIGNTTIGDITDWTDYRNGGLSGLDYFVDIRGWNGSYLYDNINHTNCQSGVSGIDYFRSYDTPGEAGTNQTGGLPMIADANPNTTNPQRKGYMQLTAANNGTMATAVNFEDFMEGKFTQPLELFKKYKLTFQYAIPCDQTTNTQWNDDNRIVFSLFDNEWKTQATSNGSNSYHIDYLYNQNPSTQADITSSSFHFDDMVTASRRLPVIDYQIPGGVQPCEWQTVTFEFTIADLMNNPANSNLSNNPQFNSLPLSFMNNAHMFDVDLYNAHSNGWPYTYNTPLAQLVNALADPSYGFTLYDFKRIFGFNVKGLQSVYIDNVVVEETGGCDLNTNFTVEQSCSTDENGDKWVTFTLTPLGPNYNPYMFFAKDVANNTTTQITNSAIPLGGVHTYKVPYVQGQVFEFKMGTWSPNHTMNGCTWQEQRKNITVDPNNNWFGVNPAFVFVQHTTPTFFPPSYFFLHADPQTNAIDSKWDINIYYRNGSNSGWQPVSTSNNPTGDGNLPLYMWFDCEDATHTWLDPLPQHSNVAYVKVRRTTYGTCDTSAGEKMIRQYVNCVVKKGKIELGEARNARKEEKEMFDRAFGADKKDITLDREDINVYPNPANGYVNIQFGQENVSGIQLRNAQGKLISENTNIKGNSYQVTLTNLPKGIYFLTIRSEKRIITKKIIKE